MTREEFNEALKKVGVEVWKLDRAMEQQNVQFCTSAATLRETLLASFTWSDSEEGHSYWRGVYDKLEELENEVEGEVVPPAGLPDDLLDELEELSLRLKGMGEYVASLAARYKEDADE